VCICVFVCICVSAEAYAAFVVWIERYMKEHLRGRISVGERTNTFEVVIYPVPCWL